MLIIKNANEIVVCPSLKGRPKIGRDFSDCGVVLGGAIVIFEGKIQAVGKTKNILSRFKPTKKDQVIDASQKIVLPGFVDCHTHAVFAGSRAEEYRTKLAGASYAKIHKKGGGIFSTVKSTRNASEDDLAQNGLNAVERMFALGTTTLEIKSGYGLDFKNEIKILRAIHKIKKAASGAVIPTFLGAHTIPPEFKEKRDEYVAEIIEKMIPYAAENKLAEFCDVFCDPLGFTPKEAKRILRAAKDVGLKIRVHAEQTAHGGGAKIAADIKAVSVEHCDFMNDGDIRILKNSGTMAVLLPGVLFHLMEWGKIRRMKKLIEKLRENKVPMALASDFNPGSSPIYSLKIIADLALRFFGLSYVECLNAITINAAFALNLGKKTGSLEPGKDADILIVDAPSLNDYMHCPGDPPISCIVKKGEIVR